MNPATACGAGRLLPRLLPRVTGSAGGQSLQLAGVLVRLQQGAAAAAARRSAVRCSSSSSDQGGTAPSPSAAAAAAEDKKRVVFCGTPEVRQVQEFG